MVFSGNMMMVILAGPGGMLLFLSGLIARLRRLTTIKIGKKALLSATREMRGWSCGC